MMSIAGVIRGALFVGSGTVIHKKPALPPPLHT